MLNTGAIIVNDLCELRAPTDVRTVSRTRPQLTQPPRPASPRTAYYFPYFPSPSPAPERMDAVEFQESSSIVFEWTLRGLKNLFESRYVTPVSSSSRILNLFQQG